MVRRPPSATTRSGAVNLLNRPPTFSYAGFIQVTLVLAGWLAFAATSVAAAHDLTVRDTIEFQRFILPNPVGAQQMRLSSELFSPDGHYFVVVTQRGDLASNKLEATIWLFDMSVVGSRLNGSEVIPVQPRPLGRFSGVSTERETNSNMIKNLHWSSGSRQLTFLAHDGGVDWHLYLADILTGKLQKLTPDDQNVTNYETTHGVTLYTVLPAWHPENTGRAVVVTGRTLLPLLFPGELLPDAANADELWVLRDGKTAPVLDRKTQTSVRVNDNGNASTLSLSPDGRRAIVNVAVDGVPAEWEDYVPGYFLDRLHRSSPGMLGIELANSVPEQYAVVDLDSGELRPLDAPLGRSLGYSGADMSGQDNVMWSRDGKQALVTNTFLPLKGASDTVRKLRLQGPAVAHYDGSSHQWTYVAPSKESTSLKPDKQWALSYVEWDESKDEVVLHYSQKGPAPEIYRLQKTGWVFVGRAHSGDSRTRQPAASTATPVVISIKQDLNVPPALFAALDESGPPREIWDPNPHFKDFTLSDATVIRWKDSQGREVKGVLLKPPSYLQGRRYPLVVEPRMYFEHRFLLDGTYPTAAAARVMAAAGIIVLQADEPFSVFETDPGWFSEGMLAALDSDEAAIDQLIAEGLVDEARIGIFGFSRTCWNALYALTRSPKRYAAATIANGLVYGYTQYILGVGDHQFEEQYQSYYGRLPFGDGLQNWLTKNPVFNLDKVITPLRIETHSPANLQQDWETYAGLRLLGKPVDLIMLPTATHEVSMPADVLESQQGDVDWFRFWLQDHEDPDPAKAAQYERWRALRKARDAPVSRSVPAAE
jgi:dipeptidyl aminopeptidase/acylaminoacyl peptidase